MKRIRVGILGATGMVGQNYISLLQNHPWFDVSFLAASKNSSGMPYYEAVNNRWRMEKPIPDTIKDLPVHDLESVATAKANCQMVFSALGGEKIDWHEENYAKHDLPVISNASAHRMTSDVPLIIPEVNHHHLDIIPFQQKNRGWNKGFIVVKPNCSLQCYMIPLYPLHQKFIIEKVIITTMQAISGAGYPGVSSLDILDNVIPYIPGEEEKSEKELQKILGSIDSNQFIPYLDIDISTHCNRVPVIDGHLACISVKFKQKPYLDEILDIWQAFIGLPQELKLPMAPKHPVTYSPEVNRPQPRLDRDNDKGMAITVGRLRTCPVFDFRFVGLAHNTIRGAAGGGILNAELLVAKHYIK